MPKALLAALLTAALVLPTTAEARGQGGRCSYCGCKGGPGYRAPNGSCVGKKALDKVCGTPPSTRCKFEGRSGLAPQTPAHPRVPNPFAEG